MALREVDTVASDAPDAAAEGASSEQLGFAIGAMVDHYRVLRLLGQGGMGAVYLARDTNLGRKVALKVILADRLGTEVAVKRFINEARTTARFSHPNIVAIHAVGRHEGAPYVALEYVEGESLRRRIFDEPMAPRATMRVGLAIAQALAEAHTHGVTHRDLKPENVMVGTDGRLRVLDFGLATGGRASDYADADDAGSGGIDLDEASEAADPRLTAADHWVGTPAYMSPEQFEQHQVGPPTDVWALGVILHELASGRRPYEVGTISKLAALVMSDAPVPDLSEAQGARRVPPELAGLIARCLEKKHDSRPDAAQVVSILSRLVGANRPRSDEENPFRGLLAFGEQQAGSYFGREREILLALERLRDSPVLPIVGPSGAGKSSLVHAGIIPRLRERGRCVVVSMRPGGSPFRALATQLASAQGPVSLGGSTPAAASQSARTASGDGEAGWVAAGTDVTVAASMQTIADPQKPLPPHAQEHSTAPRAHLDGHLAATHETPAVLDHITSEEPIRLSNPTLVADLSTALRDTPEQLNLRLTELAEQHQSRVILVIDQLEEVFGNTRDEAVVDRFLDAIGSASDDATSPVRVIFTLRDDFLGPVAVGDAMRRALSGVVVVQTPDDQALRETLIGPVEAAGYAFEDEQLVTAMVQAVSDSKAALPLLQFTASLLWERRDRSRRLLTRAAYDELGGVQGALAAHADGVLNGLPADGVRIARDLLLRLVNLDRTRRVLRRAAALEELGDDASSVLDRLAAARLLVVRKGDDAEPWVEIAHESLISHWGRLNRWLDESREDLAVLVDLEQRQSQWERRGRSDAELLRGEALRDAVRIVDRRATVPERVRRFVADSERARVRRKWYVRGSIGLSMVALVAVALFLFAQKQAAETQRARAEDETEKARAARRTLAQRNDALTLAQARAQLTLDPTLAVATLKSLAGSGIADEELVGIAEEAWRRGVAKYVLRGHRNEVRYVDWSPDGRLVASAGYDHKVILWDLTGGTHRELRGHTGEVKVAAWSPDGSKLVSVGRDQSVRMWILDGGSKVLGHHATELTAAAWSPDSRTIATGSDDGVIKLWSATGGLLKTLGEHTDEIESLTFQGDGQALISTSEDGTVRRWSAEGGSTIATTHEGYVRSAAVSFDGSILASGGGDGMIRVTRRKAGKAADYQIIEHQSHTREVRTVVMDAAASMVVSASRDGSVAIWSLATGIRTRLRGHSGVVRHTALSRDARYVATGSEDKTARLWRVDGTDFQTLDGHERRIRQVAFSADSRWLATASSDGTVRIWPTQLHERPVLVGHAHAVGHVEFAPNAPLVASAADKTVRLWDLERGHRWVLGSHADSVRWVTFDPAGKRVVSGARDRVVKVWDVKTRTLIRDLLPGTKVKRIAVSPDGKIIAAIGSAHDVILWRGPQYERLVLSGHTNELSDLDFGVDGKLITGGADRAVIAWDLTTLQPFRMGVLDEDVAVIAVAPDQSLIAAASEAGEVQVWRGVQSQQPAMILKGHAGPVRAVEFDLDSKTICTCGDDRTIRLWSWSGEANGVLRGHQGAVTAVAFVGGGRVLSAGEDGAVRLWNPKAGTGYELGRIEAPISQMDIDREARRVIVNGAKSIPIWDLKTGVRRTITVVLGDLTTAILDTGDMATSPSQPR